MSRNPKLTQGFLRNVAMSPNTLRRLINLWPPFLGAGIRVENISADYRYASVRLRQGLLNRNLFGTHFGGSLFAMSDPFYATLVLHNLGRGYVVWDKASKIDFKLPARGTVRAEFRLSDAMLADIRQHTAAGEKYEPCYAVDVINSRGEVVATVEKTLYIRRHPKGDMESNS